jgi:hypothetical protein
METNSEKEDHAQSNPVNLGNTGGDVKQKYKCIEIYKDDYIDEYLAVVYFEDGGKVSFSNLKQGIGYLEGLLDEESIPKFRSDVVGFLKVGGFDADLLVPGLGQASHQNGDSKMEGQKLGYSHIYLHTDNGGQSGIVHFSDKTVHGVRNFEEFNQICRLLDSDSAERFMSEVADLQKMGKLQDLLPNSQTGEDLQAKTAELDNQLKDLQERNIQLQIKSLSNFTLAQSVIDNLMWALEDKKDLNPIFYELTRRKMSINLTIFSHLDDEEVVSLSVEPYKLVMPDVSKEQAALDADYKKFTKDSEKLVRELVEDRRKR